MRLHLLTAAELLAKVRVREVSCTDVLEDVFRQIEEVNPSLNTIVVTCKNMAYAQAAGWDLLIADPLFDASAFPLLGLPFTVKESIDVAGLLTTAGVAWRNCETYRAVDHASVVEQLLAAGAILIGKTNVPSYCGDWQVNNEVFGRTLHPLDHRKTCGGSSGGSAALASFMVPVDIGSDLGGSIRIPASFCGLFGHRPSEGIIPYDGHWPGSKSHNPARHMAVFGVHARSVDDIFLVLRVVVVPRVIERHCWQLQLPPPRMNGNVSAMRVAFMPLEIVENWCPVDKEVANEYEKLLKHFRDGSVPCKLVSTVMPSAVDSVEKLQSFYTLFRKLMWVAVSMGMSANDRAVEAAVHSAVGGNYFEADAQGLLAPAADYLSWQESRMEYIANFAEFFDHWDVLVTPITMTTALRHDDSDRWTRKLQLTLSDGESVSVDYELQNLFPSLASLTMLPATVFPLRRNCSAEFMPVGVQAITAFGDDCTSLAFAKHVVDVLSSISI
jgi:amidase